MEIASDTRYAQIAESLRLCVNHKRLMAGTTDALTEAEKAYRLASQPPELASPWPEVAAYRLAHLLMRSSKCEMDLDRIDSLFARAAKLSIHDNSCLLGPLPAIYRLAVLHRLALRPSPQKGRTGVTRKLSDAVKEAQEAVKHAQAVADWSCLALLPQAGPVQIQSDCFNMLELACYCLGSDYRVLEGMGDQEDFFPESGDGWWVLGPGAPGESVLMSREFAAEDLASHGRAHPQAPLLVLSQDEASWYTSQGKQRLKANEEETLLLAWLLKQPAIARDELRGKVIGDQSRDSSEQTRFRQIVLRARKGLCELTGQPKDALFQHGNELRLVQGAPIFAAVDRSALYRTGRRRNVTRQSRCFL